MHIILFANVWMSNACIIALYPLFLQCKLTFNLKKTEINGLYNRDINHKQEDKIIEWRDIQYDENNRVQSGRE